MRLSEVETHIASMSELLDIVGAMRSLASMRVQEAHRALPGIRRYAEAMAKAIGSALLLLPEPGFGRSAIPNRRALILCNFEHGFVAGFNARLLDAAEKGFDRGDAVFVIGSRGAILARERGWTTAWARPIATRPQSAPETVRSLTAELYRLIARRRITRVDVMFVRHPQSDTATIEQRQLLPIDPASFALSRPRPPPLHNLAPDLLIEKLVGRLCLCAAHGSRRRIARQRECGPLCGDGVRSRQCVEEARRTAPGGASSAAGRDHDGVARPRDQC